MPDFSTEIEVDPWEYVSACSKREIQELIESLIEEGHLSRSSANPVDKNKNLLDEEWDTITDKLNQSRLRLNHDDEETIRKIVSKI